MSPGWHFSTSQSLSRVEKRTAFALPVLRMERLAGVIKEESVVAYHDQASLELRETILQYAERHDVKIISRLIENQEVGRTHQHRRKLQPIYFC